MLDFAQAIDWFRTSPLSPFELALVVLLGGPVALPLGFFLGLVFWPSRPRLIGAAIAGSLISLAFWITGAFTSVAPGEREQFHAGGEWFGRTVNGVWMAFAVVHITFWLVGILLGGPLVQYGRHRRRAQKAT